MSEFRFTDEEWREYQNMPEQGYSHRERLEFYVNRWLASRPFTEEDVEAAAKAIFCMVRGVAVQDFEWPSWVHASQYRAEARAALDAVTARRTKGDKS